MKRSRRRPGTTWSAFAAARRPWLPESFPPAPLWPCSSRVRTARRCRLGAQRRGRPSSLPSSSPRRATPPCRRATTAMLPRSCFSQRRTLTNATSTRWASATSITRPCCSLTLSGAGSSYRTAATWPVRQSACRRPGKLSPKVTGRTLSACGFSMETSGRSWPRTFALSCWRAWGCSTRVTCLRRSPSYRRHARNGGASLCRTRASLSSLAWASLPRRLAAPSASVRAMWRELWSA
mmetsp:Transcript_25213/g.70511  ORF Transcript_25213/g.70511 Transcript_25213/m.70511 type:complete len:236 (-) Transcript_25213:915-1622(-)